MKGGGVGEGEREGGGCCGGGSGGGGTEEREDGGGGEEFGEEVGRREGVVAEEHDLCKHLGRNGDLGVTLCCVASSPKRDGKWRQD